MTRPWHEGRVTSDMAPQAAEGGCSAFRRIRHNPEAPARSQPSGALAGVSRQRSFDAQCSLLNVAHHQVLPDANNCPPISPQPRGVASVAPPVPLYLVLPVGGEFCLPSVETIPVPEVAVDEHGNAALGEHDVRAAVQAPHILPEAPAAAVQVRAQQAFWQRFRTPHACHDAAALLRGDPVHHSPKEVTLAIVLFSRNEKCRAQLLEQLVA